VRGRTVILFLIALLLAGGTAALVRSWLAQRPTIAAAPPPPPRVTEKSILVAGVAITRGQILKPGDLVWRPWPDAAIAGDFIVSGAQPQKSFAGWVAREPFVVGEPIVRAKVVAPGERGFLAAVLTPGMRAVSVAVDQTSDVSGFIFPGDRVDVLINLSLAESANGNGYQRKAAETVLRDARVVAIDQRLVRVDLDLSPLRQSLGQLVPGTAISVEQVDSNVVLSGTVADAGQAEKAKVLAAALAGEVKGAQVVNRLSVATPNQVDLHVRIAEVDRNILKQIGADWSKVGIGSEVTFSTSNTAMPRSITSGTSSDTQSILAGLIPAANFLTLGMFPSPNAVSATVEALATEGFLTVLAEPNLTAVSGQTASFLAGGEFPVPVVQNVSAGTSAISVQFQQFGVQLAFTPTIIDADHLNLRVRPEVSQLSTEGEVTISGFTIPALTVRSAETTVELASGQSFALAGLLQHNTEQDISKIPWLGDIPILGALFRSNKFQNNETELVIIVTPYLVRPPTATPATPVDGFAIPHDAQQVLWGDTWRRSLPAPARGPLDAGGGGLIGPAGFRLD
jgi:pilus assembly protein CpaC